MTSRNLTLKGKTVFFGVLTCTYRWHYGCGAILTAACQTRCPKAQFDCHFLMQSSCHLVKMQEHQSLVGPKKNKGLAGRFKGKM
jgi:hypothetical protein